MSRFLHILAHPYVLMAISLIALNDFWLKAQFPSGFTGKLSDAGMLVVLPLLLAGVFSLIMPRRQAGVIGLAGVTAGYILLKSSAITSGWLTGALAELSGFHLRSIPDPSDLLLLPAIGLAAWLWFRTPGPAPRLHARWQLLLVPLAGLVVLADAAMPDRGVSCLYTAGDQLRAQGGNYSVYASADEGFTWALTEDTSPGECGIPVDAQEATFILPDGSLQYRIKKNAGVERSVDSGLSWQSLELDNRISQPEETFIRKTRSGNLFFEASPLDALLDPHSGNLLLAFGQQGVVVVRPDGSWQPAAVGPYARDSLKTAGAAGYLTLLTGELFLAVLAGLAWLGTAALRGRGTAWRVVTILSWVALLGTAMALHPEIADNSYTAMIPALGLVVSGGLILALLVGAVITRRAELVRKLPVVLLVMLLVLLPYLLWGLGILPDYWMAILLAGAIALAAAIWVK